jgi:hypothetical protein
MVAFVSFRSFLAGVIFSIFVLLISPSIYQQYKDIITFDMVALRTIRSNPTASAANIMGLKSFISRPLSGAHSKYATSRSLSATAVNQSSKAFMDAVKSRRSFYALNKESPIPDDRIETLVKDAVLHTPSAFNSQTSRLVVLLKNDHDRFWELAKEALKPMVSAEQFAQTEKKLDGFKAGYGTVRFPSSVSSILPQY